MELYLKDLKGNKRNLSKKKVKNRRRVKKGKDWWGCKCRVIDNLYQKFSLMKWEIKHAASALN